MSAITPFLWFNDNAEEAMNFYVSVFKNAKVLHVTPGPGGKAAWVNFELSGQEFMGLNGGPSFTFNEAVSFFVSCEDQAEVDELWTKLTADGGSEGQCGWLKDKFGLSWQIIPKEMGSLVAGPDAEKAGRAMQAMLQMKKIDIEQLRSAYNGA